MILQARGIEAGRKDPQVLHRRGEKWLQATFLPRSRLGRIRPFTPHERRRPVEPDPPEFCATAPGTSPLAYWCCLPALLGASAPSRQHPARCPYLLDSRTVGTRAEAASAAAAAAAPPPPPPTPAARITAGCRFKGVHILGARIEEQAAGGCLSEPSHFCVWLGLGNMAGRETARGAGIKESWREIDGMLIKRQPGCAERLLPILQPSYKTAPEHPHAVRPP